MAWLAEIAHSAAAIAGVATFHSGLDTPNPLDADNIRRVTSRSRGLAVRRLRRGGAKVFVAKKEIEKFQRKSGKLGYLPGLDGD
jgi:hypothetical protein